MGFPTWLLSPALTLVSSAVTTQPSAGELYSLTGSVELPRLIDLASTVADVPILYDEGVVRGEVVVRGGRALSAESVWSLAQQALAQQGFTTVRRARDSRSLSVVRTNEAPEASAILDASRVAINELGFPGYAKVALTLEHADAEIVAETLRISLDQRQVQVLADVDEIVVAANRQSLLRIVELVERLDVSAASNVIVRVPLRSLPPEVASEFIRSAFPTFTGGSSKGGGGRAILAGVDGASVLVLASRERADAVRQLLEELDSGVLPVTRVYRPGPYGAERVASVVQSLLVDAAAPATAFIDRSTRVKVNELTDTLHVTATPQVHAEVERLLADLTDVPPEARRAVRSIVVSNRSVEQVAEIINRLVSRGFAKATPAASDDVAASPPTASSLTGRSLDDEIELTVDSEGNRILAIGDPRQLDRIEALIEEIDKRQPQVMLEVFLVSLNEGESQDLGVELQYLVSDAGTLVGLTSLFGLSPVTPLDGGPRLGGGAGGTAVVLDPGDFSAVITAIEQVSRGRSLSRPRVLVNNNEQATLDSVVEEPFLSTNASDTVATTSFGGSSQAGTQVTVTPQIAAGDHIILEYSVSLSSFTGDSADPALPPPRQQTGLSSRATIPDGHCIVVGGIEITSDANAESRVPLLGEIPLIGELFKDRSRSASRSRFFALIRAEVLRDTSFRDLKHLSRDALDAAEVDDGFPKVHPRIIR